MSDYGHKEAERDIGEAAALIGRVLEYVFSVKDDELPDTDDYPRDEQLYSKGSAVARLMLAQDCLNSRLLPRTRKEGR